MQKLKPYTNEELRKRRRFQPSRLYPYIRSRELEGTMQMGPEVGAFLQTCMRVSKGWGTVPETKCPYPQSSRGWPFIVPKELDLIARHNCAPIYVRVTTLGDALLCLASKFPVIASFNINLRHWHSAKDGVIDLTQDSMDSAHCIYFHGYSQPTKLLNFANSWGANWGRNGHGKMSFEYFERHLQEAYILLADLNTPIQQQKSHAFAIELPIGDYDCLELWDKDAGIKRAWIIIKIASDRIEVDDLYVRPEYRRQGLATQLILPVTDMATDLGLPITAWISIADTDSKTAIISPISALCKKFDFNVTSASVGWARYLATTERISVKEQAINSAETSLPGCSLSTFANMFTIL